MPIDNKGYAKDSPDGNFHLWSYQVRDLKPNDVKIEVLFCGVCHSDVHMSRNEWDMTTYPIVPGHEFTGVVAEVGSDVTKHKPNEVVGVGCVVWSCRECGECKRNLENYCVSQVPTYSGKMDDGEITYGGYGKFVVVNENYVLKIPRNLPHDKAAPLLCAGITTYSPFKHNGLDRGGFKVAVVGLGGLGHMAVQFGKAMGNHVTVITHTAAKAEAAKALGAEAVIDSTNITDMDKHKFAFDFMLDTIAGEKTMDQYLELLKVDGTLITVGLPPIEKTLKMRSFSLISARRTIQGSCIGGIKETQDMLDFSSKHNILPWIEVIHGKDLDKAYSRVCSTDVQFRFVIDARATHGQ
eukprot:Gregarina_sp_Poly_1__2032@NODE_1533_length_3917_cov_30_684935_g252_i1_p2_GENE_NODE_1533_length_3917_cov_30_684935_g252_i1NODE_1533_length_3917_cov_30_684935_g252_i1_p2_ORF_typecomplete_len353_score46_97ADH_N/PF08240_12/5_4e26ADH_N/PF08240_12/3_3e03ADH_zinc_N/PF00107_26/2_9e21Glu_dehyd_C/PF16912_5/1_2e11ADH_zinc_N_2/PF13602_6/2_8e05AlaDh_PNT_C/PF01262_21/0_00012Hacid_dh_C/PF02826_19/5_2e032Hacid_dh_C/PF02826_19/0_0011AdoHcyase_NAD/PF00670_21/0_0059NAD_binding_2/PF03446_15/0_012Pyr_redox_2/PF07992